MELYIIFGLAGGLERYLCFSPKLPIVVYKSPKVNFGIPIPREKHEK